MEVIILLIIVYLIYSKSKDSDSFVKIENLKVGSNPDGHYDEEAFTEVYYLRRADK